MLEKVIPGDSWPHVDQLPIQAIKVAYGGRLKGQDRRDLLEKRAADNIFAHLLDHVQLMPGDIPIHSLAVHATEGAGCFFAGTPVQTYSGMQSIERVRPGAMVLTHQNRFRSVTCAFRKQYTGRRVSLRINGLGVPVVATAEHPFWVVAAEDFSVEHRAPCRNRRAGWTKKEAVTAAVKKAKFVAACDIRVGDFVLIPVAPVDAAADELPLELAYMLGVFVAEGCTTRRPSRSQVATHGEGIAEEGQRRRRRLKSLLFSMSTNDQASIKALQQAARKSGVKLGIQPSNTSEKGLRVEWNSVELVGLCDRLFGCGAKRKFLHSTIFNQPLEWRLKFLAGYFDGDGCLTTNSKRRRYENTLRANTASLNLALDMQRLLASVEVPSSISKGFNREQNGCFGKGDLPIYELHVGSAYSPLIFQNCQRLNKMQEVARVKQAHNHTNGEYLLLPVREVVCDMVVGQEIFNLEVDEDNTYTTLISGHNSNRNGDAWCEKTCMSQHKSFESKPLVNWAKDEHNGARYYENHANKEPKRSYGYCKLAVYNPRMRRIELLMIANGTKEAAERNGGLVLDDETQTKLADGKLLAHSMACRLPFDKCANCGNEAPSRKDYCTSETCVNPRTGVRMFGCRDGLTKVAHNGQIQYVENPGCLFFDFSKVGFPADPSAYGGVADYLEKAAALERVVGGAELAELYAEKNGVYLTPESLLIAPRISHQRNVLCKLAACERSVESELGPAILDLGRAFTAARQPKLDLTQLGKYGSASFSPGLRALADKDISLPARDFFGLLGHDDQVVLKVAQFLPGSFTKLLADPLLDIKLASNPFIPSSGSPSAGQCKIAAAAVPTHGFESSRIVERMQRAVLWQQPIPTLVTHRQHEKLADGDVVKYEKLAEQYALYKLAFLAHRLPVGTPEETVSTCLILSAVQNLIA